MARAGVTVRELRPDEVEAVDRQLPLNRLCQQLEEGSTYLVAWEGTRPVAHAHIAWSGTHLGLPEVQDVFVLPELRRRGIASQLTHAAEDEARARGWKRISLSVSQEANAAASALYAKLGYHDAGAEPVRVLGQITLRGHPFEVDDTLVYLVKTSESWGPELRQVPSEAHSRLGGPLEPRWHADPSTINTIGTSPGGRGNGVSEAVGDRRDRGRAAREHRRRGVGGPRRTPVLHHPRP